VRSDLITASFTARSGDVGWPKFRWAGSRASWQLLDFAAGETDILQGSIWNGEALLMRKPYVEVIMRHHLTTN